MEKKLGDYCDLKERIRKIREGDKKALKELKRDMYYNFLVSMSRQSESKIKGHKTRGYEQEHETVPEEVAVAEVKVQEEMVVEEAEEYDDEEEEENKEKNKAKVDEVKKPKKIKRVELIDHIAVAEKAVDEIVKNIYKGYYDRLDNPEKAFNRLKDLRIKDAFRALPKFNNVVTTKKVLLDDDGEPEVHSSIKTQNPIEQDIYDSKFKQLIPGLVKTIKRKIRDARARINRDANIARSYMQNIAIHLVGPEKVLIWESESKEKKALEKALIECIKKLDARSFKIIHMLYPTRISTRLTLNANTRFPVKYLKKEIAEIIGVSEEWFSTLQKKCLKQLRECVESKTNM
jgi:hypothetical protein